MVPDELSRDDRGDPHEDAHRRPGRLRRRRGRRGAAVTAPPRPPTPRRGGRGRLDRLHRTSRPMTPPRPPGGDRRWDRQQRRARQRERRHLGGRGDHSPTATPSTYGSTRTMTSSSSRATTRPPTSDDGADHEDLPLGARSDRRGAGRSAALVGSTGAHRRRGAAARVVPARALPAAAGRRAGRPRPADFTTRIDHPYWPMRPGTTWRYVERGGGEVANVRVTSPTAPR